MDLFTFKKIVAHLLMPLPVIACLLILALYWTIRKRNKLAFIAQLCVLFMVIMLGNPTIANKLLSPMERTFKQYDLDTKVNTIVVLGCGHSNDGMLPVTAQLYGCSLYRLAEAMRIYKANPGSKIITSGYGGTEQFSNAFMVKEAAIAMGIPAQDISIIESPRNTAEEADAIKLKLGNKKFALVTSASHMPRAISTFNEKGLFPIPAPAGHLAKDASRANWWQQLPQSENLRKAETWWYETMGQLAQKLG
ncbi:YdcF family protein [Paraneptunicella aestuarii]|uniref:ElyC/SanA/YdcF family protein n=1 Tax=Paraneptunicella aestuarii TaxID=2831148 RepID=UPI001E4943CE|nr:ElyC/SanA/YdcF family protein [Paraneptunicella aestuarii]UAA37244.1 YdcF family protein [Paraneptunicella aestuarii]